MSWVHSLLATAAPTEPEATTTDLIREAATFASVTLGILSAFAAQRATSLGEQADLSKVSAKILRRDFALDAALAAAGLLLLVAAGPLFVAAADRLTPLLRTDTAFFSLFCLFYFGVAAVVVWTVLMARRRGRYLKRKANKGLLASLRVPE